MVIRRDAAHSHCGTHTGITASLHEVLQFISDGIFLVCTTRRRGMAVSVRIARGSVSVRKSMSRVPLGVMTVLGVAVGVMTVGTVRSTSTTGYSSAHPRMTVAVVDVELRCRLRLHDIEGWIVGLVVGILMVVGRWSGTANSGVHESEHLGLIGRNTLRRLEIPLDERICFQRGRRSGFWMRVMFIVASSSASAQVGTMRSIVLRRCVHVIQHI